jgi:hypothetical protein
MDSSLLNDFCSRLGPFEHADDEDRRKAIRRKTWRIERGKESAFRELPEEKQNGSVGIDSVILVVKADQIL